MLDIFLFIKQLTCFHTWSVFHVDNTDGLKIFHRCTKCLKEER